MLKICNKCGEAKAENAFSSHAQMTDGLRKECKACRVEASRVRNRAIKKSNEGADPYASGGSKSCGRCRAVKPIIDFAKCASRLNGLQSICRDCQKPDGRKWYLANLDRVNDLRDKWAKNNPERKSEYLRNWARKKYQTDPVSRLKSNISSRIWFATKSMNSRKSQKTIDYLGCTIEELTVHIERQFKSGMSWGNRIEWHIDHIIPIASASNLEELIPLLHFTNLRPLWALENMIKSDERTLLI